MLQMMCMEHTIKKQFYEKRWISAFENDGRICIKLGTRCD